MSEANSPAADTPAAVPEKKKSATPWIIGCVVALVVIPVLLGIVGLVAAIVIPSVVTARDRAQRMACVNNMRMIDSAKEMLVADEALPEGTDTGTGSLKPYLGDQTFVCPQGGEYVIGAIGTEPACTVHGSMSEPGYGPVEQAPDVPVESN